MKSIVLSLCFYLTVFNNSWAFPSVGDFVRYEATYDGAILAMEKKVLAHDIVKDTFSVRRLTIYKEEVIKDETLELPRSFLYDNKKVQHVFETCAQREGALGDLVVSGKKIQVCEFYNEDSQLTYMIGSVPFGQVRFQNYLGGEEFLDFYLKKFTLGQ
jgi:hypothetical protein